MKTIWLLLLAFVIVPAALPADACVLSEANNYCPFDGGPAEDIHLTTDAASEGPSLVACNIFPYKCAALAAIVVSGIDRPPAAI